MMCQHWSALYLALRLSCPLSPRELIVNRVLPLGQKDLLELMQKWSCFMMAYQFFFFLI